MSSVLLIKKVLPNFKRL